MYWGLNAFVLSKFIFWNPNPQFDSIWRWGLWEVIRFRWGHKSEALILWPPDVKSRPIRKDPDSGNDWRQQEKGAADDEMIRQHHQLNGHEFEQTPGNSAEQGSLVCCCPWGHSQTGLSDWTTTTSVIMMALVFLWKEIRTCAPLTLCHVRKQQEGGHLQTSKTALARNEPCWHPELRLPSLSELWEISICCLAFRACIHAQLHLTLCDPKYYSSPGSSVHGILQAGKLDWISIPFSRGSSQLWDRTRLSCISHTGRQILCQGASWEGRKPSSLENFVTAAWIEMIWRNSR